ncbi:hypothetical protein CEXT_411621 [Caerostris extrusa]|uniref:Uncharacterized protein n=1 Tax=Caerostris extrusa TaxID=172846 RepID=A0AAV4M6N3_CAEEX|nr:hypothetical protein CEXT_411621 [Caerostris extrusa]
MRECHIHLPIVVIGLETGISIEFPQLPCACRCSAPSQEEWRPLPFQGQVPEAQAIRDVRVAVKERELCSVLWTGLGAEKTSM